MFDIALNRFVIFSFVICEYQLLLAKGFDLQYLIFQRDICSET